MIEELKNLVDECVNIKNKSAQEFLDETEADTEEVEVKKCFIMMFPTNKKNMKDCKAVLIPKNKKFYLRSEK